MVFLLQRPPLDLVTQIGHLQSRRNGAFYKSFQNQIQETKQAAVRYLKQPHGIGWKQGRSLPCATCMFLPQSNFASGLSGRHYICICARPLLQCLLVVLNLHLHFFLISLSHIKILYKAHHYPISKSYIRHITIPYQNPI